MDPVLVNALNRVRERAGGPGSQAFLAAIGNWLRDEGIEVARLRPLSAFITSLPGYGRVSGDLVIFDDGPVHQDITPLEATGATADTHDTFTSLTMRHDLWRAMVNEQGGAPYYLDLATLHIIDSSREGTPTELERHLTVPTVSSDEQRAFVLDLLKKSVSAESAAALVPPGPRWVRTFVAEAPPELRRAVEDARRAWIVRRGLEWMRAHGIPERPFIRRGDARAARDEHSPIDRQQRSPTRLRGLREALHRAIDRMTDEEIQALHVPARLLID